LAETGAKPASTYAKLLRNKFEIAGFANGYRDLSLQRFQWNRFLVIDECCSAEITGYEWVRKKRE
jgi:hypothetical protein